MEKLIKKKPIKDKIFVTCEGADEKAIIELLLEKDKLIFDRGDLIGSAVYNVRQLKHPSIISEINRYGKKFDIYRIGDTQRDDLVIVDELKKFVSKNRIFKYCTKPELEILFIINEGKWFDFKKCKEKAHVYAKKNIVCGKQRYSKSVEFIRMYYGGKKVENLVANIKEYKRLCKKHNKDELYLADLLK